MRPSPHSFLADRAMRQLQARLQDWVRRVEAARDLDAAIRAACDVPRPAGPYAAAIRGPASPHIAAGKARVEAVLNRRLDAIDGGPAVLDPAHRRRLFERLRGRFPGPAARLDPCRPA